MRFLKCALLVLMLFSAKNIFAQTFTVISNADAGPGTLRAALSAIPTDRSQLYLINFNLPGNPVNDGDRTIRLRSPLPLVPSNVTIDGSSQSWPALGVSGAKVIIEPENIGTATFPGLSIGNFSFDNRTHDVSVYGLYIKDFAKITDLNAVNTGQGSGIVLDARAYNIKIGAPGKGNVISGNINGISILNSYYYNPDNTSRQISIQSNIIGLHYDGLTAKSNVTGIVADLYDSSLTIGGDSNTEGNVISANQTNINVTRNSYTSNNRFTIDIINNKIGTDHTGSKDYHDLPLFLSSSALAISGVKVSATNTVLYMRNNLVSGNRTVGVSIANADFNLVANHIGTGQAGTEQLGNGIGIRVEYNAGGTIGATTAAEGNKIANNDFGIESVSNRAVHITKNSMYCNRRFGIGKAPNNYQPFVQILVKRPNFISGKATPNSEVELFYTENCQGICEGKTYFATVRAGSDGRWTYAMTANRMVTATASLESATTSEFSTADIQPGEAMIEPITCNGNGSITVTEPREGLIFTWNKVLSNGDRQFLSNAQRITNLAEGSYELIIDDGCKAVTHDELFEIKDQRLSDPVLNIPTPGCGETMFSFSASVNRGKGAILYQWISDGIVVASGQQVSLPQGTYRLKVIDEAGCTKESADYTITARPTPVIMSAITTPAACGNTNGSITNVQIGTPTGRLTYRWNSYNAQTNVVGAQLATTADLLNVGGGYYQLTVNDEGTCSPVTARYFIDTYNSVNFSEGIIKRSTCNTSNGSISGVAITFANRYEWTGPAGTVLETNSYSEGQLLKLENLAAGTYTLRAWNTVSGCNSSKSFRVDQILPTVYAYTGRITGSTCGIDNGSIVLNYSTAQPVSFAWKDAAGIVLEGTARELKNLAAGTYRFFSYDENNCESVSDPYVIERIPLLVIEPASAVVVNDGCSLLRGSVTGIKVNGGLPPYSYTWENEAGSLIQSTADLIGVPGGRYRLVLKDNTSCGIATSEYYTVENPSFPIERPGVNDMRVCYSTEIMLPVMVPEEGTYELFQDVNDTRPMLETTNGKFVFKVSRTADYYVRRRLGSCYSSFTKVHIEVTNDNMDIKNTLTPNGDGINDVWMITGLPDYNNINIKIYSRSGQLVYESTGRYEKPFDGRFRGKDLPAGAYYYRIDLRADCDPIGGSLTLLR
ncbi:hypothetical protein PBAL39_04323 [Pedobacter sp. BAL39]|uniref:gliding motility-associated C-terminal domain-containing protein n=1 Tax=Pedobacter sp. BAL39 TaxID=391596 RepID=UPI0001559ACA|nr:T9SS C-terminal target domain-containing protein [Pedobacter sp. BAL39]EDM36993.1 hypothetical protein PBAL39_04323 [Pedobacter sp. BAL39]